MKLVKLEKSMYTKILFSLPLLLLTCTITSAIAHSGRINDELPLMQHIYAHIGTGWMLLISLVILFRLVLLFGSQLRPKISAD